MKRCGGAHRINQGNACPRALYIPPRQHRGSLGTAHIHSLSGLVRAAQAKHGSVEGMAAAVREKVAKRERAAASKLEAAAARRQALADAAGLQEIR